MDAGLIEGFVIGFSTGALVVGLLLRERSLERPGPNQAEIAADQERYFGGAHPFFGYGHAQWQAAQQQEASNQRSDEAMGGLGNVPSNVVSKEGSLEEREAKLQAQINANPDIQALITRHRAAAIPVLSSPADPKEIP